MVLVRSAHMLKRVVLNFVARGINLNKVARRSAYLKPGVVARYFHAIPPRRSNCDFGSPCDCSDCMESARRPVCEICEVQPTAHQSSRRTSDRKGISGYRFTSFCGQCWEAYMERERKGAQEIQQELAARKDKVNQMMKDVRGLESAEQVPIRYAVEKCIADAKSTSSRWSHRRDLIMCLSQDLKIVKIRNRYMCNKRRVDSMDFKLWCYHDRPDIEI